MRSSKSSPKLLVDVARTLFLGPPGCAKFQSADFLARKNLDEFNTIVWCPFRAYGAVSAISNQSRAQNRTTWDFRLAELARWTKAHNTLICLIEGSVGGDLLAPLTRTNWWRAEGKLVEYVGPKIGDEVKQKLLLFEEYSSLIDGPTSRPLLRASAPKKGTTPSGIVGAYETVENGDLVLMPAFSNSLSWLGDEVLEYINAIQCVLGEARQKPSSAPSWTRHFVTISEATRIAELKAIRAKIATLEAEAQPVESEIESLQAIKLLFSGSGDALVTSVRSALESLGLKVVEGPHPHADLLVYDGSRLAALEVKGLDGSAKKNNISQCIGWVTETQTAILVHQDKEKLDAVSAAYLDCLRKLGVPIDTIDAESCRGMVIISAHARTELDQRHEPTYPHPVAEFALKARICALSGLQLMTLLDQVKVGQRSSAAIVELLFSSVGVLPEADDWKSTVSKRTDL